MSENFLPKNSKFKKKIFLRLIDLGMLHYEASISGLKERYERGKTLHTIHVWWARRPHSAMRALVFASLCKNSDEKMINLLTNLTFLNGIDDKPLLEARKVLKEQYNGYPKILDMFSGGGTIPFEAMNLGAHAFSIDSNQLAVFNQKSMLYLSQLTNEKNLSKILESSGKNVLERLSLYTEPLFPMRKKLSRYTESLSNVDKEVKFIYSKENFIGYLWTYSKRCSSCNYKFYLIKRPWLSKKKQKNLAFVVVNDNEMQKLKMEKVSKDYEYPTVWSNSSISCPNCGVLEENVDIRICQDELIGLILAKQGKGKSFTIPVKNPIISSTKMEEIEKNVLDFLDVKIPKTKLPKWSGIVNPALYGVKYHADIFNQRQRIVILLLIKSLYKEFVYLLDESGEVVANYVISLLSAFIDQLVDWNCRITMWISQNEQAGRGFCGPGIPMYWDYVEIDPILFGPANLWSKLDRILNGVKKIKHFPIAANIQQGLAQNLPFEDEYFDAIVTDPPYYDNLYYSILADFFYVWKAMLVKKIEPELFKENQTNYEDELVASSYRDGDSSTTHKKYCEQLELAFNEAARVLKKEGVFSFIYSHSSVNAWMAIVQSYRHTNFLITSVEPLSIERKQRPRAMTSNDVNTCIVFIARKFEGKKSVFDYEKTKMSLIEIMDSNYTNKLLDSGWNDKDVALAIFAHGVLFLANTYHENKKLEKILDEKILVEFVKIIKSKYSNFNVKKRKSL